MSYWPTAQAPTTASGPPLSMLPLDPMYYPQSCYENQNVSLTEHRHAATEDHYQPDIASACAGTTYGTAGMMYPEQDTTLVTTTHATALPAHAQHPTIAHNQSESGHDPAQHVATVPQTALYEVSTHKHPVGDGAGSHGVTHASEMPCSALQIIPAILTSGHTWTRSPRQPPRNSTSTSISISTNSNSHSITRPQLRERTESRTWPRPHRRPKRRASMRRPHPRPRDRSPRPSRPASPHLAPSPRWATYRTRKRSRQPKRPIAANNGGPRRCRVRTGWRSSSSSSRPPRRRRRCR